LNLHGSSRGLDGISKYCTRTVTRYYLRWGTGIFYHAEAGRKKIEKLVYVVDGPVKFEGEKSDLSLFWVRAKNSGAVAAENVNILIKFPSPIQIIAKKINLSSMPLENANLVESSVQDKSQIHLRIERLLPGDTLTVALQIDHLVSSPPNIVVRSNGSIGALEIPNNGQEKGDLGLLRKILLTLLIPIFALTLRALPMSFVSQILFTKVVPLPVFGSRNNTGFIFLHQDLVPQAKRLLENAVFQHGGEPLLISNYALALGLDGDLASARKMLSASSWWARTRHEKAVVLFNRGLLEILTGDESEGIKLFEDAVATERRDVLRYSQASALVKRAAVKSIAVKAMFQRNGIVFS